MKFALPPVNFKITIKITIYYNNLMRVVILHKLSYRAW